MPSIAEIDTVLQAATAAKQVPGVVALAMTDKGATIYDGVFGVRDLGRGEAMTRDTVFWIASMTKAVTGVAAMQLVEQGKLALDAPIGGLLPELAEPKVLDGGKLRPAKRPITLRHLLTHTAGFCYDIWNAELGRYMQANDIPAVGSGKLAALRTPLMFEPGERWEYGINIDWAGKAVERVSGKTLDAYFQDHIFAPLGMADTGYRIGPAQRARRAGMHQRGADGSAAPIVFEMPPEPESYMGGGGLYSTAPDYMTFLRMLLGRGSHAGAQLLKPETVAVMGQNHIGDLNVGWLRSAKPERSNDANFFPDQPQKWGLSFLINTQKTAEGRSPGSLAWAGLGNTYFWLDPAKGVAGVILMQLLPFVDAPCMAAFRTFERGVYRAIG